MRKSAIKSIKVLDSQVNNRMKKLTDEEILKATNRDTPFVMKSQTVRFYTPDVVRSVAREDEDYRGVFQSMSKLVPGVHISGVPADDERALALEDLESAGFFDGKVFPYKITGSDGQEKEIFIQFDIRYFNIPNNVLYEKMPKFLTDEPSLHHANEVSWQKMRKDVHASRSRIKGKVKQLRDGLTRKEKVWLDKYHSLYNEAGRLRQIIVQQTKAAGIEESKRPFGKWREQTDELVHVLNEAKSRDPSPAMKELIQLLTIQKNLIDLYQDVRELYESGLSKSLSNMDSNRSALGARLVLLGAIIEDVEVHMGCRSGKDRTGLVDIEVKLLMTLSKLYGRIPSYREQEKLEDTTNLRETMTLESGNTFDLVAANLGASVGINTKGSASHALGASEAKKNQYAEFTSASQAFAAIV